MSANNWEAGDLLTRSKMNQPFFMQSGNVALGVVQLRLSPGRIYFPHVGVVARPASQQFQMAGCAANTNYAIYMDATGEFRASGYTGAVRPPGPPMPGAQYLGSVQFGSAVDMANTLGPWTTPSGAFEGRGEYVAIDQAVPRVRVAEGIQVPSLPATPANIRGRQAYAVLTTAGTATLGTATVGEPIGSYTVVHGMVGWVPSGSVGVFGLDVTVTKNGTPDFTTIDARQFVTQSGELNSAFCSTPFSYVSSVSGIDTVTTYALTCGLDSAITSDANAGARVKVFSLVVEPGRKNTLN